MEGMPVKPSYISIEDEKDGYVWWKVCSSCGELKRHSDFPVKSLYKKLANGKIKRGPRKRTTICHQCTYWRDRGCKVHKNRSEVKVKQPAPLAESTKKAKNLMKYLTPELHPYLKL